MSGDLYVYEENGEIAIADDRGLLVRAPARVLLSTAYAIMSVAAGQNGEERINRTTGKREKFPYAEEETKP